MFDSTDQTLGASRGFQTDRYLGIQGKLANRIRSAALVERVKIPFAIQWIWPIPLFILVTLAPESPWFLVRGRLEEAEHSVSRLAAKDERTDPSQIVAMMVRPLRTSFRRQLGLSSRYAQTH